MLRLCTISLVLSALCAATMLKAQEYIVLLRSDALPAELQRYAPRYVLPKRLLGKSADAQQDGMQNTGLLRRLQRYIRIVVDDGRTLDALRTIDGIDAVWVRQMYRLHDTILAEEPISRDSLSGSQYALELIGARNAWRYASGNGVIIGIIDTGIDWDHEDLRDALSISSKEDINKNGRFDPWPFDEERLGIAGDLNGIDDDDNGMTDDVIGADFVDQEFRNLGDDRTFDPVPFDEHGHGTLVAGVIAATKDNGKGIAGLAYDARLRAIRAFDATGSAEEDDIAAAIVYAASNKVNIINMSFGDGVNSPLMQDAIEYARIQGCILVASAGNSGQVSAQYPASYAGVIVVAATNSRDMRAPFSSIGPVVSLSAPGQAILTTSVNSRYRTVSGTSFSAPYVAAAAALLIEQNPDINADEVRGTLMASSKDLGAVGWDVLYGSGRLRSDAALEQMGLSRLAITAPVNEQEYAAGVGLPIKIHGSTHIVSFDRCEVAIGVGVSPDVWNTFFTTTSSVINDVICDVTRDSMSAGLYTLRVRVYTTDGRHHDAHVRIRIVSSQTGISSYEHVAAWTRDRRTDVVTVGTNRPTLLTISHADVAVHSTPLKYAALHSIVLPDVWDAPGSSRTISITASPQVGSPAVVQKTLDSNVRSAMPTTGWDTVLTAPWAGYVLNDARDIYRDGSTCVVMNDLSDGGFGKTVVTEYSGGRWILRDSLSQTYIPRALCDVNGNGLYEVLCHVVGKTVLFEQQTPSGSLFGSVPFADTTNVVNAAGAADIDGDGREEILALADNACFVYTCKNGTFSLLGTAKNTSKPASGSATNRVDEISIASGDFNGNGKMEIAFSDTDGDLVVHEWNGASFNEVFIDENTGAGGSGFVASGDVNADGRPDILLGVPDSVDANADGEYGRKVWTYYLYSADQASGYRKIWTDRVAGVRIGIGFRNGVALADVDSLPGAEIIVSAFPRLFMFGVDAEARSIAPKAFFDDVATPRVLTYDVNGDGRPELGFGSTIPEIGAMTSFTFVQQNRQAQFAAPKALRGVHRPDETSLGIVDLSWYPVAGAASYQLMRRVGQTDSVVAIVDGTSYAYRMRGLIDSLISFVVKAVPEAAPNTVGRASNRVTIDARGVIYGVELSRTVVSRSELLSGLVLEVRPWGGLFGRGLTLEAQTLQSAPNGAPLVNARYGRPAGDMSLQLVYPGFTYTGDSLYAAIKVPISRDMYVARTFVLAVVDAPTPKPSKKIITLSGVAVQSPLMLHVRYSHKVDETGLIPSAYVLRPTGTVRGATRIDSTTIALSLDPAYPLQAKGVTYSITANNVGYDTTHVIADGAGSTLTFSVYGTGEQDVYAYPQPLSLQAHADVIFAGLPPLADIEVFDSALMSIATISSAEGNGGVRWGLRNSNGQIIPPGIYFYVVTVKSADGASQVWPMKKLLIQR
ncbi:MAG: S8 family serine peptidase [Ignavibacteria bacterium]